jgi:hypothetical protein
LRHAQIAQKKQSKQNKSLFSQAHRNKYKLFAAIAGGLSTVLGLNVTPVLCIAFYEAECKIRPHAITARAYLIP